MSLAGGSNVKTRARLGSNRDVIIIGTGGVGKGLEMKAILYSNLIFLSKNQRCCLHIFCSRLQTEISQLGTCVKTLLAWTKAGPVFLHRGIGIDAQIHLWRSQPAPLLLMNISS